MLEDKLEIIKLIDVYGNMLTKTKIEILKEYYFMDISLGEIAEVRNISRQAVHDSIVKSLEKLKKYESELKIIYKQRLLKTYFKELLLQNKITQLEYERVISIVEE
ncbi:MAG: hypothetical protein IJW82_03750 [Clostridia bacterium]|nr:hypothetical protein [Clostridia bacterium]